MYDDLYFLPIIAEALGRCEVGQAIHEAIRQIEEMGRNDRYRRGYEQFQRFMAWADSARHRHADDGPTSDTRQGADRGARVVVLVERERNILAALQPDRTEVPWIVEGITPGRYRLITDTGWVLWEGDISEPDVLWAKAYDRRAIEMAADTGQSARQPTQEIAIASAGLIVRVYAGIETGVLEITAEPRED